MPKPLSFFPNPPD